MKMRWGERWFSYALNTVKLETKGNAKVFTIGYEGMGLS